MPNTKNGNKKKRLEELIAFLLLFFYTQTELLADKSITSNEWYLGIGDKLALGHSIAAAQGRSAATGEEVEVTVKDQILGQAIAAEEKQYLADFKKDIDNGRYTDGENNLSVGKIENRLELYSNKMRSTMLHAFVEDSPEGTRFLWILDDANHCQGNHGINCPALAERSPYTAETLPAYPGDGTTPCMSNCRCQLMRLMDDYNPLAE